MLATIDLRSQPLGARDLRAVLPRAEYDVEAALEAVEPICDEVHDRGAAALYDFAERFDGVRPTSLRVPAEVLTAAVEAGGFEPQTQSAEESPEIAGSMADMEVEPAECKVFMSAAAAAVDDTDATIVIGAPSDGSTTIGGALGYADESAAADMLSSSTGMLDTCSDMSISAEGMEMTASTSEVDASVDGADQVVATEMAMDVSGQEMSRRLLGE